jgi:hypothetical protein
MPVEYAAVPVAMGQEEFHAIDRIVMGEVFAMHISMGRFFDERIYQEELAHRCANIGLEVGESFRGLLFELFDDLGLFLDAALYKEALLQLTQASGGSLQTVPVICGGRAAGFQNFYLLNPECAWHLSANRENQDSYEVHLTRLFRNTPLRAMHWINLNQRHVTLKTLTR